MESLLPSLTATWHNDTYPAISPSRPELSAAGKTVVITGAGSGIGQETAIAFSQAGASKVVLLGRTEATLQETASKIPSKTSNEIHVVDVTREEEIQRAATSIGQWDILILSAGYLPNPTKICQASTNEWWKGFETNVKGPMMTIKAFTPGANPSHAAILTVVSGPTSWPATLLPGLSSYITAKMALTKLTEFVAAEHEHIFAASVHPGMIETAIFNKSGATTDDVPMDKVQLPAHFMVWLCSSEASFLKGRSVWVNWDVEELKSQASKGQQGLVLTSGLIGWPFASLD